MFERKLTSFSKSTNKTLLRDYFNTETGKNYKRISPIINYFGIGNANDTYEYLLQQYNEEVERRQRERKSSLSRFNNSLGKQFVRLINNRIPEFNINIDNTLRQGVNNIQNIIRSIERQFGRFAYGRQVIMRIGNMNYTLNNANLQRLLQYVNNNLVQLEDTTESDGQVILQLTNNDEITFSLHNQVAINRNLAGGFFKYLNTTKIDLSKYGIYTQYQFKSINWKDEPECLVKALKEGGMADEKVNYLKTIITDLKVPISKLNDICDKLKIKIILKKPKDNKELARNTYGKEYDEVYNIAYFDEHYFINDETEYTSYSIKNYNEISNLKNFNKMERLNVFRGAVFMNSFKMIETMFDYDLFTPISFTNSSIMNTQYYSKIEESIKDLRYDENNAKLVNEPKEQRRKTEEEKEPILNVFFDFETHTDNDKKEHTPYLCCAIINGKNKSFFGEDCGLQLLKSLRFNCRLIAHNASYDFRFIIKYITRLEVIMKGTRMMSAKGMFGKINIEIKCSYHLISMPLADFPKTFGIADIEKEVMPYSLYNCNNNVNKKYVDVGECLSHLNSQIEKNKFIENCNKWECIQKGKIDIVKYSWKYCEIDCEVLKKGYNTFKTWITEMINLNIDEVLTTASLAHRYFINQGCYDDVYQFSGVPRMFLQKFVIGGRTMCSSNKKSIRSGKVNDFDAVSLYPSAMSRLDGFLKGKAKIIRELKYDSIKSYNGYFVEIVVKSVGIKRQFPLMSYIDKNGVRIFSNEMIGKTLFVDKTTLEDLIQFQNIEFDIIRGYYFDEGFNSKIKQTISFLFNERNKMKKAGNKAEMIYKLLMNSGYGKSIMKPIEDDIKIFDNNHEKNVFIQRNYNWVKEFTTIGNEKTLVKSVKPLNDHFNIAQVGICILSMSKRIMNEVMCLAEDLNIDMFYQDTDSIHLYDKDIDNLSSQFRNKYNRELIGKNMGQFHSDFDGVVYKDNDGNIVPDKKLGKKFYKSVNMKEVYAIKSVFLGKKCYIDQLECIAEDGDKYIDYHIRMKGVPSSCVLYTSNKLSYANPVEMFMDMYKGKEISFDLTEGGKKDNFDMKKDYTITTKNKFERKLKF